MLKKFRNNILIFSIVCLGQMVAYAQEATPKVNHEELIYNSYREYVQASRDYLSTQRHASEMVREWRKKRLAEIFNEKLDRTERNLILSNSTLIEEFNKFIKANGVDSLDDVLLIRLAQLYFEKASLEFNNKMKNFNHSSNEIPVPNYRRAILFAKLFVAKFTESALGDKAYYLLGIAHEEMSQADQSIAFYESLLKNYPTSGYSEEVAWRLGEIYFVKRDYRRAAQTYARLIKLKGTFYTKGLYKLGATYFAERHYKNAVRAFEMAIKEIDSSSYRSLDDQVILDESLDYLATILSNDPNAAIAYEYLPEAYYRLGLLYKKRLDERSMREVYAVATKRFKTARQLPLMYQEIIKSFEDNQDYERANQIRSEFVQTLTHDQKWWESNAEYKTAYFDAQDTLEFNLIKSAEFHSEKGYRNKDTKQLQIAKDRYSNFISQYPWSTYKYYAKLELADIEYYLQNYERASSIYFEIVNESSSQTLREEAAYSLIWSEVKKVNFKLNFEERPLKIANRQEVNLSPNEQVFAQAAIFYISKTPYSHRKDQIIYKLAEVYAEKGDLEKANQYLHMIVDSKNSSDMKIAAFRFLEQIHNVRNDWASIERMRNQFNLSYFGAEVDLLDTDNIRQRYRALLEESYNLEMEGKFFDAGVSLEKVITNNIKSPIVDFLRLKAAALFVKSGSYAKAESLIGMLERTKYKAEAQFLKAQVHFQTVQYSDASYELEGFVLSHRKHPWFERALMNLISVRNKTFDHAKTTATLEKLDPLKLSADVYYMYIENLLALNRIDDVYKTVAKTRNNAKYDMFRMQYLILRAQHDRFDYVGLEKTCESVLKSIGSRQTAFANLNRSFCEYSKLKMVVGHPETTLDSTVNALNQIHNNKIEPVTTKALTEVINKSELRNQFRRQFDQLISKGWVIASQQPFSKEVQELSRAIVNFNGRLPLSMAYMMNWKGVMSELIEYKSFDNSSATDELMDERSQALLLCESKQYANCMKALVKLEKKDRSNAVYENLIVTSLKMNSDEDLKKWLGEFSKLKGAEERSKIYASLLREQSPSGQGEIRLDSQEPMTISAKAMELWSNDHAAEAAELLTAAVKENPQVPHPYYVLAQMYFEQGKYVLAHSVVESGYRNTNSRALVSLKYQFDALSGEIVSIENEFNHDLSPAELFGMAFYAIKNKDKKSLNQAYRLIRNSKNWFDSVKSLELVASGHKRARDIRSTDTYSKWLHALYEISQGRKELSLPAVASTAKELHAVSNFKGIERVIMNRTVAGDEK